MINRALWLLGLLPLSWAIDAQGSVKSTVPGSYLVEFPMDNTSSASDLDAYMRQFSREMADRQIPFRFVNNYTTVFHGCNIAVGGEYTSLMSTLESVKVVATDTQMSSDAFTKIARRSLVENPPLPQLAHESTNYDKLLAKHNVTGKGVKIGIIDSGIDYNHPAFGSCYKTPGCRIQYGHDFVGDNFNGSNTPQPDDDPMDNCNGHGTHVAGIAAGNDNAFRGTAPEATLGIYRVMGCRGKTSTSVMMAALQMAYNDGMDVINVSISFPSGFTADIASFRTEAFAKKGVIVVASVGNEGIYSMWMAGSPAVGSGALAVGSSDPEFYWSQVVNITTSTGARTYSRSAPQDHLHHFNFVNTPVMVAENGGSNDACSPLTHSAKGSILVTFMGECSNEVKVQNAINAGAVGLIIAMRPGGDILSPVGLRGNYSIPAVTSHYELYSDIKIWGSGGNHPMLSSDEAFARRHNAEGPVIASYSSWGPGTDLSPKPDLIAPGSNIYSALPLSMGRYGIISGTSMSSPYVSGIVALMREKFPQGNVTEIKSLLIHVANLLRETLTSSSGPSTRDLGSIVQQGGGTINVENIMDDFGLTIENRISIGDDTEAPPENPNWRKFTVTLKNNTPKTYRLNFFHHVGLTITSYSDNKTYADNITYHNFPIVVRYQPVVNEMIQPFSTFTRTGFIELDNVPADKFYVVTGYNFFRIYDGNRYIPRQAPWMGLRGRFRDIPMLPSPGHQLAPMLYSPDGTSATSPPYSYDASQGQLPKFRFHLMFNCELILFQIGQQTGDSAVQYHAIEYMYATYARRNYELLDNPFYNFTWTGTFKVDNTVNTYKPAPAGTYFFSMRLLKPTAKENETDAFVTWESPEFQFLPAA
ncbi:hypothetical protein IWQ62_004129 [Dispira parvispora]|uniref:Peptidase S8/S53 domain-containing protein n=1 Tax=Dispira parvispora TaxID=1520584 RepID=A0A9W8AMI9_9FUNG|nr:hypothetical protein IWQ62_004129 [Dispira parvispora]